MAEELTNIQKSWRSVPWLELQKDLERIGVFEDIKAFNLGAVLQDGSNEKVESLINLLVEFMLLYIRTGEFIPHSINPVWRDNPKAILKDWFYEGAEEFVINATLVD